jgi:hypothetical protein
VGSIPAERANPQLATYSAIVGASIDSDIIQVTLASSRRFASCWTLRDHREPDVSAKALVFRVTMA